MKKIIVICYVFALSHISLWAQEYKKVYFFDPIIFEPIFTLAKENGTVNKHQYLAWQNKKNNTITVPLKIISIKENIRVPNCDIIMTFSIDECDFEIKIKNNYITELKKENKKKSSTEYYRRDFNNIKKLQDIGNSWSQESIDILFQIYAVQDIMFLLGNVKPGDIINIEVRAYRQEQKLIITALKFSSCKYIKELSIYNNVLQNGYLVEPVLLQKQVISKPIAIVNASSRDSYPLNASIRDDNDNVFVCNFFPDGGLKNFVSAQNKKWGKQILWDDKGNVIGEMNYPHEEDQRKTAIPRKPMARKTSLKGLETWHPVKPQKSGLDLQEKKPDFGNLKRFNMPEALWLVKHIDENFYYSIFLRELFFRLNTLAAQKQNILYYIDREITTLSAGTKRWAALYTLDAYGRRYCSNVQGAASSYAKMLQYKNAFQKFPYLCFRIMADIDYVSDTDAGIAVNMNPLLSLYAMQGGELQELQKRIELMRLWLPVYLTAIGLSPEERPEQIKLYPLSDLELIYLYREIDSEHIKSFAYLYRTAMIGDYASLKAVRANIALTHPEFPRQSEQIRRNIYLALSRAGNIQTRIKWCQIAMNKGGAGYSPLLKLYWEKYRMAKLHIGNIAKIEHKMQKQSLDSTTKKKIEELFRIHHSPYLVKEALGEKIAREPVVNEYIRLLMLKLGQDKATAERVEYKTLFDETLKRALNDYSYPNDVMAMYFFVIKQLHNQKQATTYLTRFVSRAIDPDAVRIAAVFILYHTNISIENKLSLLAEINFEKYDLEKFDITSLQAAYLKKQKEQLLVVRQEKL